MHGLQASTLFSRRVSSLTVCCLPREQELITFIDRACPPLQNNAGRLEFVDVNPRLERVVSAHINMDDGKLKGFPWVWDCPGTRVGSGKICMRYSKPGAKSTYGIRCLESFEEMRMLGWDDSFWSPAGTRAFQSYEDVELISNIAGNAFSAFNCVPFFCSLLSTAGKFASAEAEQEAAGNGA